MKPTKGQGLVLAAMAAIVVLPRAGSSHLCQRTALAADSSSTAGEEGDTVDGRTRGYNRVEIEYCTGCRWMLRAAWLSQELLTTFQEELDEVAIMPSRVSGTFDVRCNGVVVWSRKEQGRFPEAKEVKWGVRDVVEPGKGLGHSERKTENEPAS